MMAPGLSRHRTACHLLSCFEIPGQSLPGDECPRNLGRHASSSVSLSICISSRTSSHHICQIAQEHVSLTSAHLCLRDGRGLHPLLSSVAFLPAHAMQAILWILACRVCQMRACKAVGWAKLHCAIILLLQGHVTRTSQAPYLLALAFQLAQALC